MRELVLARLSQPESERATVEALANQADITFNLDSVYRSMDYLDAPMIDKVCRMSHEAAEAAGGTSGCVVLPRFSS